MKHSIIRSVFCALISCAVLAIAPSSGLAQIEPGYHGGILASAGAPGAGTSEVQTITLTTYADVTLKLGFRNDTVTVTLDADADQDTNTEIDTAITNALESMSQIGSGGVTVVVTGTTDRSIAITYAGNLAKLDVPTITAEKTAGTPTVGVVVTTPGVTAFGRKSDTGQLVIDKTNGKLYINTSTTKLSPTWTVVGSQS